LSIWSSTAIPFSCLDSSDSDDFDEERLILGTLAELLVKPPTRNSGVAPA